MPLTKRINCEDCKFFERTGFEDFYNIGDCEHPNPTLGGALTWKGVAEWLTCYQAKRKRKRKAA